jgi:hypothetical protein
MTTKNKFYMAGTEGTGDYTVIAVTDLGRIGYRVLGSAWRIRVEPATEKASAALKAVCAKPEWKQPGEGGQFRFSTVQATDGDHRDALVVALTVLLFGAQTVDVNPDLEPWLTKLVAGCREVGREPEIAHLGTTVVASTADDGDVLAPPLPETADEERIRLVAEARKLGIRGANSRWKLETLRAKVAAAR